MTKTIFDDAADLTRQGRFDEAESLCQSILQTLPDDYQALYLLSSICLLSGRHEESRKICNRLLELNHKNSDVFNTLAAISADYDHDDSATELWLNKSLECNGNKCDALINLGNLRFRNNSIDEASAFYELAIKLGGDAPNSDAFSGLAMVAASKNEVDKTIGYYREALKYSPNNLRVLANLMIILYRNNDTDEAIEIALKISDENNPGPAAIGAFSILNAHGFFQEAESLLTETLNQLENKTIESQMYMMANMHLLSAEKVSDKTLYNIHLKAGETLRKNAVTSPVKDFSQAFQRTSHIRIGYISSDLCSHVVSHFLNPLITHRNKERFEVFIYSNLAEKNEDKVTLEYKKIADHFINIYELSDQALAERIREDGIHVLVELNGYTRDSRLSALAYLPAPVQVSYLGYPFSCGMKEIDYFITDPWLNGPENTKYFIEQPLQLPQSFICFGGYSEQKVAEIAPRQINGYVTFGSLSSVYKLNKKTIELWSEILIRVPKSRIYLNHPTMQNARTRNSILKEFSLHGITQDRISILWKKNPSGVHLQYYNEIDIALDSLPLTGGTTTIDSLWMGVPMITLVGDSHRGRLSYSLINNVGIDMNDCIAFTSKEYVERAVNLARNQSRMDEFHKALPSAMVKSILCNKSKFTQQIEDAYINAWNQKFPKTPIETLLTNEKYIQLPVKHPQNCFLVLHDVPTDIHTYVLKESQEWYEVESAFLARHTSNFNNFWDFSEDPGMFAVPIALSQKRTGGATFAFRNPGMVTHLLDQSITVNHLDNLHIVQKYDEKRLPDLVRFSIDFNDGEGNLIIPWLDILDSVSPLFLVSLHNPSGLDLSAMPIFAERGFQAYRLLPGYDLLVPHQYGHALLGSDINLFFCKEDLARKLSAVGLLCLESITLENMPHFQDQFWKYVVEDKLYASTHIDKWLANAPEGKWGELYIFVLNLYAEARNVSINPTQRFANIKMLESIITLILQSEATASRLLTGIRVMVDAGKREDAVRLLSALLAGLEGHDGKIFNEPFLAPESIWETLPMSINEVDWAVSTSLVAREKLSRFSSWFTAEQGLEVWKRCLSFPWIKEEAMAMIQLIENNQQNLNERNPAINGE